jgi:hypothetical protein
MNKVEPVQANTPRDQGYMYVSDFTGCRNTMVLFYLTEILCDHKVLSDVTGCQKTQVSDLHSLTIFKLKW